MQARTLIPLLVLLLVAHCDEPSNVVPERPTYRHDRPSWSNDGLTIVFRAEINGVLGMYAVDSSGQNLRLVHAGDAIGFSWSPDSRWIVFSKAGNLYRIKPNGDSIRQLTATASDLRPAWSRDGVWIAYFHRPPEGGIFAIRSDSSSAIRIDQQGNYPSWDNLNRIVVLSWKYFSFDDRYQNYFTAYRVDSTSSELVSSFYSWGECSFPQVRSDGKQIVFVLLGADGFPQIYLVDLTKQQIDPLTEDGGDTPSYSPDNKKIVYQRVAHGDGGLWVMDVDGTNKRRLTAP